MTPTTQKTIDELDDMMDDLRQVCECEIHCIGCGKLVMYADPTHHEGMQMPDMICLRCKKKKEVTRNRNEH